MERKYYKNLLLKIIALFLILTFVFVFGYSIGEKGSAKNYYVNFFPYSEFKPEYNKLFSDVWSKIKDNFINQEKINPDRAAFEAIRGLVRSLDDPHSDLYTPRQTKILEEDLRGKFCGAGMEIGIRNGVLTVISPLEDSPAYRKGIKAGDLILKINKEDTMNMSLEEAVSKIRGECKTKIILTLIREGWENEKDFEIIREEIIIIPIKKKFIEPNIGYIKIITFNLNTIPEFLKAYNELLNQGVEKFILDLRNNPGGYLEISIQMSELFIPRGKIILKEQWGKKKAEKTIRSQGPGSFSNIKAIIITNKGSASASEIFAAALRDNLGIKIIGEKTFGKGSVQQTYKLNSYLLKLTIAYWFTPKNVKLEGNGLDPDIKAIDKNLDDDKDEVLEKAIELIKKI